MEGRGITGDYRDDNNIWIPTHVSMIRRVLADVGNSWLGR